FGRSGWNMAHGPDGCAADEPRGAGLDAELLWGTEQLRHHSHRIVQHGTWQRGSERQRGNCPMLSGWHSVHSEHPGIANQLRPRKHIVLAAGVSGHGADHVERRHDSISAIWRGSMVVHGGARRHAVLRRLHDLGLSGGLRTTDGHYSQPECRSGSVSKRVRVSAWTDWSLH